jgi:hypothetical protein
MAFGYPTYGYQPNYPGQQMYGNQYPQYGQQTQPPMQSQTGLNRVTGIEGARAFQVPPNSVVPLFDDTQDVFYIKTTDSGGFPTLKGYRFSPIEDTPTQPTQGLTRPEVEQIIREELAKYEQQSVSNNIYSVPPEYNRPKQHDGAVRSVSAADAGAQSSAASEQSAQ